MSVPRRRTPGAPAPRVPWGYCPSCWRPLEADESRCRSCGAEPAALSARPYSEKLIAALRHPIGDVRERAARLLGKVAGPEAREPLLRLAREDRDPYLAAAALFGLHALLARHPALEPVDWAAFALPERPLLVRTAALEILKWHAACAPARAVAKGP